MVAKDSLIDNESPKIDICPLTRASAKSISSVKDVTTELLSASSMLIVSFNSNSKVEAIAIPSAIVCASDKSSVVCLQHSRRKIFHLPTQ